MWVGEVVLYDSHSVDRNTNGIITAGDIPYEQRAHDSVNSRYFKYIWKLKFKHSGIKRTVLRHGRVS